MVYAPADHNILMILLDAIVKRKSDPPLDPTNSTVFLFHLLRSYEIFLNHCNGNFTRPGCKWRGERLVSTTGKLLSAFVDKDSSSSRTRCYAFLLHVCTINYRERGNFAITSNVIIQRQVCGIEIQRDEVSSNGGNIVATNCDVIARDTRSFGKQE